LPTAGIEHVFVTLGDGFEPSVAALALACRFAVKCRAGAGGSCRLVRGNVVPANGTGSQKFGRLSKLAWDTSKYSIP